MIHTLDAIKSCQDHGVEVVGGFASELIRETIALGGEAGGDNPGEALTLHPEVYKVAVDRLLERAGVTVLFHALVCGVTMVGDTVTGVEVALRDGRARISAGVVIDCTGDAEVVHHAGADWNLDRDLQAMPYHFRLGSVPIGISWSSWEERLGARAAGSPLRRGNRSLWGPMDHSPSRQ